MSNIKLPFLRSDAADGKKRLWRVVPTVATITAAAVGAALIGGVAGPASATAQAPARSAWASIASSDNANTAVSRYVTVSGGRFSLDTSAAEKAGVSSQALSAESTMLADLNKGLARDNATADNAAAKSLEFPAALTKEQAAAAGTKSTTITLVPGFTITISSTGVVVYISKGDVTEIENVAGFAKDFAALLASAAVAADIATLILSVVPGANVSTVMAAGIVTAVITFVGAVAGFASDVLKICTAADGSATFTLPLSSNFPWIGIPSCSAQ